MIKDPMFKGIRETLIGASRSRLIDQRGGGACVGQVGELELYPAG